MNFFRFKMIHANGTVGTGTAKLPFADPDSAASHLERDGSVVLYVKEMGGLSAALASLRTYGFSKKMARTDQAELLNNLALMLRAGMPVTECLEEVADGMENQGIANDIYNIMIDIQRGTSFSEAVASCPHIFPKTVCDLIKIGEETGQLDKMLQDASDHLKHLQAIVSGTKQALMYPSFVILALSGGLLFWLYSVAPKIIAVFEDMGVELPALTRYIMLTSYFIQDYLFYILGALAIVVVLIVLGWKLNRSFRKFGQAVLLKLPVVGTIMNASILAFISEYFSLLVQAGINVLSAIQILHESLDNEVFKDKLNEIQRTLKRGESISETFQAQGVFPTYVTRMIRIGETSGTLTDQLTNIADTYRDKLSTLVATIGKSIEPIVLVIAGVLFAVLIGGLFVPIYDLVGAVGSG